MAQFVWRKNLGGGAASGCKPFKSLQKLGGLLRQILGCSDSRRISANSFFFLFFRIGAPFVASLLSDALCSERSVLAPSSKGAPFVSPFMFAKWERAEKKDHTVSILKSNKSLGRHCVAPQDACDLKART